MMSSNRLSPDLVEYLPEFIPLEAIRVATPCHAEWRAMRGDARTRFCGSCQKNVYNLSEMTRDEAAALIQEKEGQLCVRYYQRADGTILTQDCSIGMLLVDSRIKGRLAIAALLGALIMLSYAWADGLLEAPASVVSVAISEVMSKIIHENTSETIGDAISTSTT